MASLIQIKGINLGNGRLSGEIGRGVRTFWTRISLSSVHSTYSPPLSQHTFNHCIRSRKAVYEKSLTAAKRKKSHGTRVWPTRHLQTIGENFHKFENGYPKDVWNLRSALSRHEWKVRTLSRGEELRFANGRFWGEWRRISTTDTICWWQTLLYPEFDSINNVYSAIYRSRDMWYGYSGCFQHPNSHQTCNLIEVIA
jgi:hypothetical protein